MVFTQSLMFKEQIFSLINQKGGKTKIYFLFFISRVLCKINGLTEMWLEMFIIVSVKFPPSWMNNRLIRRQFFLEFPVSDMNFRFSFHYAERIFIDSFFFLVAVQFETRTSAERKKETFFRVLLMKLVQIDIFHTSHLSIFIFRWCAVWWYVPI